MKIRRAMVGHYVILLYMFVASGMAAGMAPALQMQGEVVEMRGGMGLVLKTEVGKNSVRLYCHHNASFSGLPRPLGVTGECNIPSPQINLGEIKPSRESQLVLDDMEGDWCFRKYVYLDKNMGEDALGEEDGAFSVELSRVHPAVIIESGGDFLSLFEGKHVEVPGYVAWRGPKGVEICATGRNTGGMEEFSGLTEAKWVLFWLGRDVAAEEGQKPEWWKAHQEDPRTARLHMPVRGVQTFRGIGDIPLLVVCLKPMLEIQTAPDGVAFTFRDGVKAAILAPYGLNHPLLQESMSWAKALPEQVVKSCDDWAKLIERLPKSARESWRYESESDTAIISEEFVWEAEKGVQDIATPLPPMLALAKSMGFPVELTAGGKTIEPRDTGLLTAYGPYMVIEGAASYTLSLRGFGKYARERRAIKPRPTQPSELYARVENRLLAEVTAMLQAGHLAGVGIPIKIANYGSALKGVAGFGGGPWYANTGLALQTLCRVWEVLPDGKLRDELAAYITRERHEFPPEVLGFVPGDVGARREPWWPRAEIASDDKERLPVFKRTVFQKRNNDILPLENFYGLSEYYLTVGKARFSEDNADGKLVKALQAGIRPWLSHLEWASAGLRGWDNTDDFVGGNDIEYGQNRTSDFNRLLAGLTGYVRLMQMAGRASEVEEGMSFLGRALMQRYALARYAEYLYLKDFLPLPEGESAIKDIRPLAVDEEGVYLYTLAGYHWDRAQSLYLGPYMGITPETGRFAAEFFKAHSTMYATEIDRLFPDWFMRFGCRAVGDCEDHINKPTDSPQIFNVRAWVLGNGPEELARFIDAPWVKTGDWYFMERLTETLIAARGVAWQAPLK